MTVHPVEKQFVGAGVIYKHLVEGVRSDGHKLRMWLMMASGFERRDKNGALIPGPPPVLTTNEVDENAALLAKSFEDHLKITDERKLGWIDRHDMSLCFQAGERLPETAPGLLELDIDTEDERWRAELDFMGDRNPRRKT